MLRQILLLALIAVAGCSRPADPSRQKAMADVGAIEVPKAATGYSAPHRRHTIAFLQDRGGLVGYPANRMVRHDGAYTWHRADLSEEHAFNSIGGVLHVTTPLGQQLAFNYERHVEHPSGDWTWVGRLQDHAPGEAILTFGEKAVFGTIAQPDGAPLRLTTSGGALWLIETDQSKVADINNEATRPKRPDYIAAPKVATPTFSERADEPRAGIQPGATASATVASGAVVDVVLGYTTGFATALGGQSQAVTRMNNMVEIGNQAYVNSQVDARLRLVQTVQVNYPDNTDNDDTLERLTGYRSGTGRITPDSAFATLRAARDQYGADLVSLVRRFQTPENNGCGIAWLIGGDQSGMDASDEFFGYSVVSDGRDVDTDGKTYFCREETLVHELGHNMGSQHDRATATKDGVVSYGIFPYSFGYKTGASAGNFYTVMAYGDTSQTAYRVFSNPRITYCAGLVCGVTDQADNARSLTQTIPIVARFRSTIVPPSVRKTQDDIDGDGKADLLWRNADNTAFMYWALDGTQVVQSNSSQIGSQWRVIYTGDVTGDGRMDIVWSNGTQLVLSISEGSSFQTVNFRAHPIGWRVVGGGDINGDGKSDMLWRNADNTAFMYWVLDGTQVVQSGSSQIGSLWNVIYTGDVTGDRRMDIVWSSGTQLVLSISEGSSFQTVNLRAYPIGWRVVGGGDINGDGKVDLLWRNTENTAFMYWALDGTQVVQSGSGLIGAQWSVIYTGDVTGDGRMDIVWSNGTQLVQSISEGSSFGTVNFRAYPTGWRVANHAPYQIRSDRDINGDGKSDLLWRNTENTAFMYWALDGTQVVLSGSSQIGSQWNVIYTGDVTGDGRMDIVWSNGTQLVLSISEGSSFGTVNFRAYPTGWRIVGGGDINGDGKVDLLWRNTENTAFMYWALDGTQVVQSGSGLIGAQWSVICTGDVTGDGRMDIVWSNGTQLVLSISEGNSFGTVNFRAYPTGWRIVGGGDINGDGKVDLLWRNTENTAFMYWALDGTQVVQSGSGLIGAQWSVIYTGDVTGDGRMDIVWSNSTQLVLSISEGKSFGTVNFRAYPVGWRAVNGRT